MIPLEGVGAGLAAKAAIAAGKRFLRSTEFDRLCQRLSERFESVVPFTAADYASWADSANFAAAIGALLSPPHTVKREVLVSAIQELVGPLDDERGPEVFAGLVADVLPEEIRMSKTGDALVRFEADLTRQTITELERVASVEAFCGSSSLQCLPQSGAPGCSAFTQRSGAVATPLMILSASCCPTTWSVPTTTRSGRN